MVSWEDFHLALAIFLFVISDLAEFGLYNSFIVSTRPRILLIFFCCSAWADLLGLDIPNPIEPACTIGILSQ